MLSWYKIADDEAGVEFGDNQLAVAEVNGRKISLARHAGNILAFAYGCPHASAVMSEGWLDGKGNVVCPLHGYKFNMVNGRNVSGEGYQMKCWPVERRVEGIFVGMEG